LKQPTNNRRTSGDQPANNRRRLAILGKDGTNKTRSRRAIEGLVRYLREAGTRFHHLPHNSMTASPSTLDALRSILDQTLSLGPRAAQLTPASKLLGSIPELDSMAVINVLTALEDRFGFTVDDDEIDAQTFATFGSLVAFVESKLQA